MKILTVMPGWIKQARLYLPAESTGLNIILSEPVFSGILISLVSGISLVQVNWFIIPVSPEITADSS